MQCMACVCVFKPLFSVNNLFEIHTIYFVIQLYKTHKMQRQGFIDYSPVPDSPPQSPREPEMLSPSMRSDPSPVFARQHRGYRRHRQRTQQRRPQERRRQWRDVPIPDEDAEEERRVFKGKWGPRFCRNQSCKKSPRRSPRSPHSPPAAAMVAGGTKNKTRTNRSRKCKNKRRKCKTNRGVK